MTTTSAAENLAGHPAEKEKVEKRRALGRGLESLLPGPRVVAGTAVRPVSAPAETSGESSTRAEAPAPHVTSPPSREVREKDGAPPVIASSVPAAESVPPPGVDIQGVAQIDPDSRTEPALSLSKGVSAPHEPLPHVKFAAEQLAAQIPPTHSPETITIHASAEGRTPGNLVVNLPLDQIDKNPYQTRYLFDQELLAELAESIRVNGVVQPVMVRPGEDGRYVLILGERRCRASVIAGKTTIPAIVKRVSDQQAAEMTVVENLQRQDLNCLEQAEAFRVLSKEFRLTQQQIGERVGLSRESVSNYMRLLKLKQGTMEYLTGGALSFTDARLLLALEDPEIIEKAADEVVEKHLTGELIEDLVMRYQGFLPPKPGQGEKKRGSGSRWMDPNVRAAQTDMERVLGLRVRIRDRNGRGKIVIEYSTVDDYERVVEVLRGKKG
jgi:ParB family chromosome partitioning protein